MNTFDFCLAVETDLGQLHMAVGCEQDEIAKMVRLGGGPGYAREQTLRAAMKTLLDVVKKAFKKRIDEGNRAKVVAGMEVCVSSGRGAKGKDGGQDLATFFAELTHDGVQREDTILAQVLAHLQSLHLSDDGDTCGTNEDEYNVLWYDIRSSSPSVHSGGVVHPALKMT